MSPENRRGIALMIAAMALFIVNDAIVKLVSAGMPTAQLIFLRGVMASALVAGVAWRLGALAKVRDALQRWVLARATIDAVASVLYLASLVHLPLANATAISLASPLFIAVLAVLVLSERVGARRWTGIALGFAGVLLIVQPAARGFNAYALLCVAGTALHAVRDLLTRRIGHRIPSIAITLATAIVVTLIAGAASLVTGWRPFGARELALLALASAFLAGGYHCVIASVRHGELSLISSFRYTGLLWALAIGWVVWGDVPNALAWLGIVLLVGAGLDMLRAERAQRATALRGSS